MNDGAIVFSTELDNKELEKQLNSLTRKIDSIQDRINQKQAERSPLAEQSKQIAAQLDAAKARLEYMQSGEKFFSSFSIQDQEAVISGLQKEWDGVQTKVERYDDAINRATIELNRNKEKAGMVAKELGNAGGRSWRMSGAMENAGESARRFALRLREVIRSALIFTLITQALAQLREWLGKVIATNAEASSAVARLKGALYVLAQPLVSVVIPAFTAFVNVLAAVIMQLARLASIIFGTTIGQSQKSAKALYGQVQALDATGKSAKKAAKAVKDATKSMASFDEINQLTSNDTGSTGDSGGTGNDGYSGIAPDFSSLNGLDTKEYKEKIDEITVYISGALLALGIILAFSGANIPLGLGLMVLGAVGLATEIKENWDTMNGNVKDAISNVLSLTGGTLLAIGAILCFSGANIPLGIGLMTGGVTALAVAVGINWDSTPDKVKSVLQILEFAVGGALLALGAMLCLTGANIPLGLAFLVAGAVSLVAAKSLNWDTLPGKTESVIGAITGVVSGSLLALGALLCFGGVNLPLGIGLMAAGAASLASAAFLNWDYIVTQIQGPVGSIAAYIGGMLIVLGAILCLSGASLPLGIALIAAGAASLVTVGALNWNAILDKMKEVWGSIQIWWASSVAPKLTLTYWQAQFNNIKEGLVSKIKDAVNGGITLFNRFIGWINDHLKFSWDPIVVGGIQIASGGAIQLFKVPEIPMLAQGAVIPPNREFLAVLGDQKQGTNIETPLSTMVQAFKQAVSEMGGSRPLTIIMEVDKREFGRVVYQANNDETQRVGVRFAT